MKTTTLERIGYGIAGMIGSIKSWHLIAAAPVALCMIVLWLFGLTWWALAPLIIYVIYFLALVIGLWLASERGKINLW